MLTGKSVVVVFDTGMRSVPVENPLYKRVRELIESFKFEDLAEVVDMSTRVAKHTDGLFYVVDSVVYVENDPLPDTLSKRLIEFMEQNLPCDALVNFWNKLKLNPSLRSREMLWSFLDHNGIPLTEDGCFICYKRVDSDYKDCHTHTFDNSPGCVVSMLREEVDDDPERTCSSGLHVAAFPYAKSFYSNGILVEVKVDPEDVVAVPNDYNGQKMRVCEYEVIRDCQGELTESLYTEDRPVSVDEDADEDVWDDVEDVEDDEVDDWDDEDDWDDDWDDDEPLDDDDVPVVDDDDVVAYPDGRGRIAVPKDMLESINLKAGGHAVVTDSPDDLIITKKCGFVGKKDRVYVVDKSGNIRISDHVLGLAKLNDGRGVKIVLDGKRLILN